MGRVYFCCGESSITVHKLYCLFISIQGFIPIFLQTWNKIIYPAHLGLCYYLQLLRSGPSFCRHYPLFGFSFEARKRGEMYFGFIANPVGFKWQKQWQSCWRWRSINPFSLLRLVKCFHVPYPGEIWKRNNPKRQKKRKCNHVVFMTSSFSETSVFEMFFVTLQRKAGVFKFLRTDERFWKASFSWLISVDGKLRNA